MKGITAGEALAFDRSSPAAQNARVGSRAREAEASALRVFELTVAADATGAPSFTLDPDNAVRILDAFARCTAANASGTLTLQDSAGTAITNAMTCAVDKAVGRATSLDPALCTVPAGGSVRVDANGAGDRGVVTVIAIRA